MKIAAMTSLFWSQRNSAQKITALESIRRLRKAGFTHIDLNMCGMGRAEGEFCGEDWQRKAEELGEEAEKLGVQFVQSHAPYYSGRRIDPTREEYLSFFRAMLLRSAEISHMLGIEYSVVHPVCDAEAAMEDKAAHVAASLALHRDFLERGAVLCIKPAFENMCAQKGEDGFCHSPEDLIQLCDALKEYQAGICWDFGHANLALERPCEEIRKLKNRVYCVHTHDNGGKKDDHLMPFLGRIEWEKALPALRETGFHNDLVLEVAQNSNLPDALKDESSALCAHASELLIRLFQNGEAL